MQMLLLMISKSLALSFWFYHQKGAVEVKTRMILSRKKTTTVMSGTSNARIDLPARGLSVVRDLCTES